MCAFTGRCPRRVLFWTKLPRSSPRPRRTPGVQSRFRTRPTPRIFRSPPLRREINSTACANLDDGSVEWRNLQDTSGATGTKFHHRHSFRLIGSAKRGSVFNQRSFKNGLLLRISIDRSVIRNAKEVMMEARVGIEAKPRLYSNLRCKLLRKLA